MTSQRCFTNVTIFTESTVIQHGWLITDSGLISDYGDGSAPESENLLYHDCKGNNLLPGFLDLHIHGAIGYEIMDATPQALKAIAQHCARHGVTSFLPTTWTASHEAIMSAIVNVKQTMKSGTCTSQILGIHLEGPYINKQFSGAQYDQQIRPINMTEAKCWLETGVVRLFALAPELPAAIDLILYCVDQEINVSAAHSGASFQQMKRAINAGLKQITHTFNAMRPLHHREPGILGTALSDKEVSCEVIADGIHIHPEMVKLLYQIKGSDNLILITDSIRGAGMPEGSEYEQDGRKVRCFKGSARLSDGTLAGSILTMDQALANLREFTSESLAELWPCTSLTPARAIHMDKEIGSITIGKRADLVLLSEDGQVMETIVAGKTVYRSSTGD